MASTTMYTHMCARPVSGALRTTASRKVLAAPGLRTLKPASARTLLARNHGAPSLSLRDARLRFSCQVDASAETNTVAKQSKSKFDNFDALLFGACINRVTQAVRFRG